MSVVCLDADIQQALADEETQNQNVNALRWNCLCSRRSTCRTCVRDTRFTWIVCGSTDMKCIMKVYDTHFRDLL